MGVSTKTATEVVNYCNKNIVPDAGFIRDNKGKHPITWFQKYFDFVDDIKLRNHLADAYYQARFVYKLMVALNLTSFKKKAVVKFQTIQYASIYEALIDYVLDKFHRDSDELKKVATVEEYKKVTAFSKSTKVAFTENGITSDIHSCKLTSKSLKLKEVRFSKRVEAAVALKIIKQDTADKINWFYELRNNVHLTTAAINKFYPSVNQSIEAFEQMDSFIKQMKKHINEIKAA